MLSLLAACLAPVHAADTAALTQPAALDYLEPTLLSGTVFEAAPEPKHVLFLFRRTATRSNSTVRALREYNLPDGRLAAREQAVYESGRLVSYESDDLQAGTVGKAIVRPDPRNPGKEKLFLEYTEGEAAHAKKKTGSENLQKDTLNNDTIAPFIQTHFDELLKGRTVKFRIIALARAETVGFKLVKTSETIWRGKPAVVLKMEPTSFIIAQLVEPLFFTVEKGGEHRVLQYAGRTTPKIKRHEKWEDLDALTVFDWK